MSAASRFIVVISVGALMVTGTVVLLWLVGVRGPRGVAFALAPILTAMLFIDDRLAERRTVAWRAVGAGAVTGLAGWVILTILES